MVGLSYPSLNMEQANATSVLDLSPSGFVGVLLGPSLRITIESPLKGTVEGVLGGGAGIRLGGLYKALTGSQTSRVTRVGIASFTKVATDITDIDHSGSVISL